MGADVYLSKTYISTPEELGSIWFKNHPSVMTYDLFIFQLVVICLIHNYSILIFFFQIKLIIFQLMAIITGSTVNIDTIQVVESVSILKFIKKKIFL